MFEDMLKPEAMNGTVNRKFNCPLFFLNYLIQKKASLADVNLEDFDI